MNSLFDENEHASPCQLLSENSSVSTDLMFSPSRNFQNSNLEFTQSIVDETILNENETTDLNNNLTVTNTSEPKNNNTTLLSSTEKLFQAKMLLYNLIGFHLLHRTFRVYFLFILIDAIAGRGF